MDEDLLGTIPDEKIRSMLRILLQERKKLGKELGLDEAVLSDHTKQKLKIRQLVGENSRLLMALKSIVDVLQPAAGNRKFMQIARPARECLNILKPFTHAAENNTKTRS